MKKMTAMLLATSGILMMTACGSTQDESTKTTYEFQDIEVMSETEVFDEIILIESEILKLEDELLALQALEQEIKALEEEIKMIEQLEQEIAILEASIAENE